MSEIAFRKAFKKWYELSEKCLTCELWEDFMQKRIDYPCDTCGIQRKLLYYQKKWVDLIEVIGKDKAIEIIEQVKEEIEKKETK